MSRNILRALHVYYFQPILTHAHMGTFWGHWMYIISSRFWHMPIQENFEGTACILFPPDSDTCPHRNILRVLRIYYSQPILTHTHTGTFWGHTDWNARTVTGDWTAGELNKAGSAWSLNTEATIETRAEWVAKPHGDFPSFSPVTTDASSYDVFLHSTTHGQCCAVCWPSLRRLAAPLTGRY